MCTVLGQLSEAAERTTVSLNRLSFTIEDVRAIDRYYDINPLTRNRHSSYYIPPYFSVFGSSRPVSERRIRLPSSKVQKNVRPKGTHTHWKFYR